MIALVIAAFVFFAKRQAKSLERDPVVLMNKYYLFKKTNPDAAKMALKFILQQNDHDLPALKALSAAYLEEKNLQQALPLIQQLHHIQPDNDQYTYQLAALYYERGEWEKAFPLLLSLKQQDSLGFRIQAQSILNAMASFIPHYTTNATVLILNQPGQYNPGKIEQIYLDLFYKLKTSKLDNAKALLTVLQFIAPDNAMVNEEMGYMALQKKDYEQAIHYFLAAFNEKPSARLALQLGYVYMTAEKRVQAAEFFLIASQSTDLPLKSQALKGYEVARQSSLLAIPGHQLVSAIQQQTATRENLLLDHYYLLKKKDKKAAWVLIQQIINDYPKNVVALKEGGYLAISQKAPKKALLYFSEAYRLTYEPELAMQLGYLYNQTADNYQAYHYFKLATYSSHADLSLRAENALTNLAGLQTKALPSPYFSEIFFDPFSQTRFGLTVRPIVSRIGVETKDALQSKFYLFLRQTDDNKSAITGQISQIYEDDVRITGVGMQISPFKSIPMVAFIEAGPAYDLVFRQRSLWRGDLRSGLMYYNVFGAKPAYFDKLKISHDYYSTLYGDMTYFSRYNNNVIATVKTHQGIRLAQYKSSMLNLYMTGRIIEDTNRVFYNNIAEIGPGISFIPSNRFNLELRYEFINGEYLPVGNSNNPYGKYYTNSTVQLLVYVKL